MNIRRRDYMMNLNKSPKDNITDEAKGKRGVVLRVKCCTDIKYQVLNRERAVKFSIEEISAHL